MEIMGALNLAKMTPNLFNLSLFLTSYIAPLKKDRRRKCKDWTQGWKNFVYVTVYSLQPIFLRVSSYSWNTAP